MAAVLSVLLDRLSGLIVLIARSLRRGRDLPRVAADLGADRCLRRRDRRPHVDWPWPPWLRTLLVGLATSRDNLFASGNSPRRSVTPSRSTAGSRT